MIMITLQYQTGERNAGTYYFHNFSLIIKNFSTLSGIRGNWQKLKFNNNSEVHKKGVWEAIFDMKLQQRAISSKAVTRITMHAMLIFWRCLPVSDMFICLLEYYIQLILCCSLYDKIIFFVARQQCAM
jgi:hypothetical protein